MARLRARGLRRRLMAGVTLMTLSTAGFVLAPAAVAQEGDEQQVEVESSALYASPPTDAIPRTLTNDFPPTAVCVVRPEICPPELDPVRDPLRSTLGEARRSGQASPVQPVPPDTVAVAYLGGATRYQSAIKFPVPPPPAGEEYVSFQLIIPQTQPSYDLDSPAFRRIVLGLFAAIGPQDPGIFFEGLVDALQNHDLVDLSHKIGIEACALTLPFEEGGAPQAFQSDEIPRDEHGEPALNCIVGANGTYDAESGDWTFDLTFAAQDWTEGKLENHGILLRPTGGHNLAFGDPDLSNNAQVTLDITDVRVAMETAEPPPPIEPFDDDFDFGEAGTEGMEFTDGGFVGGFDDGFASSPMMGDDLGGFADQPEVAQDDLAAPGEQPMTAEPDLQAMAPVVREGPSNPWWMWLLIPAFMIGTYLTAQTLTAAPAAAAATQRPGAMSRLIARRNGAMPLNQI